MKFLNLLLLAIPVSIFLKLSDYSPVLLFVAAGLSIIPLAGFMGKATEEIAIYVGPRVGGLLNATFGNAAELIIMATVITAMINMDGRSNWLEGAQLLSAYAIMAIAFLFV